MRRAEVLGQSGLGKELFVLQLLCGLGDGGLLDGQQLDLL